MTNQSDFFSSYNTDHDKVKIDYGIFSFVSEKGLVHTTTSLFLSSVLHVPSFATNLLSISRIPHDLNCSVIFFPSSYVFQDLQMRTTIDSGKETKPIFFRFSSSYTRTVVCC